MKLPILYLIDSIVKNVGRVYIKYFSQSIVKIFIGVFEQVNEILKSFESEIIRHCMKKNKHLNTMQICFYFLNCFIHLFIFSCCIPFFSLFLSISFSSTFELSRWMKIFERKCLPYVKHGMMFSHRPNCIHLMLK